MAKKAKKSIMKKRRGQISEVGKIIIAAVGFIIVALVIWVIFRALNSNSESASICLRFGGCA